jgi:Zn-dependent protease with chaperone function
MKKYLIVALVILAIVLQYLGLKTLAETVSLETLIVSISLTLYIVKAVQIFILHYQVGNILQYFKNVAVYETSLPLALAFHVPLFSKKILYNNSNSVFAKEAILAHEAGHLYYGHGWYTLLIRPILTYLPAVIMLAIIENVYLEIFSYMFTLLSTLVLHGIVSREMEYSADKYSHNKGFRMIQCLRYLDNVYTMEIPKNLWSKLIAVHPTIEQRIKALS